MKIINITTDVITGVDIEYIITKYGNIYIINNAIKFDGYGSANNNIINVKNAINKYKDGALLPPSVNDNAIDAYKLII